MCTEQPKAGAHGNRERKRRASQSTELSLLILGPSCAPSRRKFWLALMHCAQKAAAELTWPLENAGSSSESSHLNLA
eukprot:5559183-Pleurochrysis_carterae.AAC.1